MTEDGKQQVKLTTDMLMKALFGLGTVVVTFILSDIREGQDALSAQTAAMRGDVDQVLTKVAVIDSNRFTASQAQTLHSELETKVAALEARIAIEEAEEVPPKWFKQQVDQHQLEILELEKTVKMLEDRWRERLE